MKRFAITLAFFAFSTAAIAQSVQQSGTITPNHMARWVTNGVIADAGTAANPFISSIGAMPGPICVNSGPLTGPYNAFCMSASKTGGGVLSIYNYGGATGGFSFSQNGTPVGIPAVQFPVANNNATCFADSSGTLKNCSSTFLSGTLTSGHIFVGNASNVATDVAVTGDASINNAGAWTNLKVNGVSPGVLYSAGVGTGLLFSGGNLNLADTTVTPAAYSSANITVDQQGRITAAASGGGGLPTIADGHLIGNATGGSATAGDTVPTTWFDHAWCSTVGWIVARTIGGWVCAAGIPANVEWFNVLPGNSGATNQTNFQAMINTAGVNTAFFPKDGYSIAGTATISKPFKVSCAYTGTPTVSANIIQTTTSATTFDIRASNVEINTCSIALAGSPTGSATGITIGVDAIQKPAGGSFVSTSTTLNCATCAFVAGDVGKRIWATGVGAAAQPLFTSIATYNSSTQVLMANAAGTTNAAATFAYGNDYTDMQLERVMVYNYIYPLNIVSATRFHISHSHFLGSNGAIIQNILWGDQGDGGITDSSFNAVVAGGGNFAFDYQSGGGLRVVNSKFLAQAAITSCVRVNWNYTSSVGPFFSNNSIEGNCSRGFELAGTTAIHGGIIMGNEIGIGSSGTGFYLQPGVAIPNWTFTGNIVRQVGGGSAFFVGNMQNMNAANNSGQNVDANAGGLFYNIQAGATGKVDVGSTNIANTIQNSATGMIIIDNQGMPFTSLPTAAANGSQIFVSNGAPASTPCTGASTGSTAFRQNGAWKCF